MTAYVIRADSRTLPLADNTVDLVVTSPPYFGLRSYQDGGKHYAGQVGDEATPAEFVDALLAVTEECMRVLKPTGSLWVNLGDKYAGSGPGPGQAGFTKDGSVVKNAYGRERQGQMPQTDVRSKSLIGTPWRYALRCIDDIGLILRAEVIWSKPNGLPESVTDRVRRSHEQWFHFVLEPRYFSAVDEVREEHVATSTGRNTSTWQVGPSGQNRGTAVGRARDDGSALRDFATSSLGKLPGSVWTIPTQPLQVPVHLGVDHFAAFPMEWPRRIIRGWSPSGICVECGEGRRPVVTTDIKGRSVVPNLPQAVAQGIVNTGGAPAATWGVRAQDIDRRITAYACDCDEWCFDCGESQLDHIRGTSQCPDHVLPPTRPAVVLDPFGGTGTTALVASALGRTGISCDLSHDYSRLARWRTTDPGQRAAAMQVEKPPVQIEGQGDLFGDVA